MHERYISQCLLHVLDWHLPSLPFIYIARLCLFPLAESLKDVEPIISEPEHGSKGQELDTLIHLQSSARDITVL